MKKLLTGVLAIAMVLTLVGGVSAPARAATIDELQAQIAQLQALLASLTGSGSSAGYTFTMDLTVGSTGQGVVELQKVLVAKGFLTMPAGVPMGYFGLLTRSAVAAWQASVGITPAVGYFGPISRARMNATVVVTPGPGPGTPSGNGDEGQLTDFDNTSADVENEVHEGEDNVNVLGVEFDAEDSDMTLERVDVDITVGSGGSSQLDNYITEVSIVLDGKTLATQDVDEGDEDDDVFSFRFTGLNGMVSEDDTAELFVAVSGVSNVDSSDSDVDLTVDIPVDGIRAVDEAGISDTYTSASDLTSETFNVVEEDAGDLDLSIDQNDNDDRTIAVEADTDTNGEEILVFTLESDTGENIVDEIEIDLATSTATSTQFATVIKRLHLYADGTLVGSEDVDNNVTLTGGTALFDDLDLSIDEDEEVEFTVKADFNDDADLREGFTFAATVNGATIDAEDSSGDEVTVAGSVTGGTMVLRTIGVEPAFVSESSSVSDSSDSETNDRGTYTIVFDVTAFGEDIYVDSQSGTSTDGIQWSVTGDTFTGSASSNVTCSGCEEGTGNFVVEEGTTERFTLTVVLTNTFGAAGFYGVQIDEIGTGVADDSTAETAITAGLEDLETDEENLET